MSDREFTFTLKLNRQIVIWLVIGLVVGSLLTVGTAGLFGLGKDDSQDVKAIADSAQVPDNQNTAPTVADIKISNTDHVLGNKDAKVVLVEYSDFECPFCGRHYPTMKSLEKKYGDKIAIVFRHFPLSFHAQAMPAALASECAGEQGKFWEFHDAMYENQAKLGDAFYNQTAKDLGLDAKQFSECYASEKYKDKVSADLSSGQINGVDGTPATFVNGVLISGAVQESQFSSIIDQELTK